MSDGDEESEDEGAMPPLSQLEADADSLGDSLADSLAAALEDSDADIPADSLDDADSDADMLADSPGDSLADSPALIVAHGVVLGERIGAAVIPCTAELGVLPVLAHAAASSETAIRPAIVRGRRIIGTSGFETDKPGKFRGMRGP